MLRNHSTRDVTVVAVGSAVVFLGVLAVLNMTDSYEIYGLFGIFVSFAGGVMLVSIAVLLRSFTNISDRVTTALLTLGFTLLAGAVILYLIFGCVFGCPA